MHNFVVYCSILFHYDLYIVFIISIVLFSHLAHKGCKTVTIKSMSLSLSLSMSQKLLQEAQLLLRDCMKWALQLKSCKLLHKCRRLAFEKPWNWWMVFKPRSHSSVESSSSFKVTGHVCSPIGTRKLVHGLSCGVVCVILCVAASIQYRLVTDGQTDRQTYDDS